MVTSSADLLPPMLLISMARYLQIDLIVILTSKEITDENIEDLALISKREDMSSHVLEEQSHGGFDKLRSEDFARTMIVDFAGFHMVVDENEKWFTSNIAWLVPYERPNRVAPKRLRLDSQFYTVSGGQSHTLKEVYRAKLKLFENNFGTWNVSNGLDISTPYIWNRRKNLRGITISAASLPWAVFSQQINDTYFMGYVPEVLETIALSCNFSVAWITPADGNYGAPLGNGSFNGLTGLLQRKETDIVAAGFAVTLERSAVVSYSNSLFESQASLIILDPTFTGTVRDVDSNSYLSVFTPLGWLCLFIIIFALKISYCIFFFVRSKEITRWTCLEGLGKAIWFVYSSGLQLSLPYEFSDYPLSSRIFFMVAGSYSIIFIGYYQGVLTSFLTVTPDPPKFSSIGDVVDQGYKVVVIAEAKHDTDFRLAPPGTGRHKAYHKTMKGNPDAYFPNFETLTPALLNNPSLAFAGPVYSFIGDSRFLPLTGLADATVDPVAFGLQKASEFMDLINYQLLKMENSGMQPFLRHKWIEFRNPEDTCGCKVQDEAIVLSFKSLFAPVLILGSGIALGISLMIMESLLKFLRSKPN